jgi:hypothetical protein
MHGKDLVIPKGTEITAYINGDTPLNMAKFAQTEPISNRASGNPAAGGFGQVSIDSNVSNCDIEVDGAFAGNTPSQLSLSAGTHKITVSQKGYVSWSKAVLVTSSGLHLKTDLDVGAAAPVAAPVAATTLHQYNCPRLKGNNIGLKSRQILEKTKASVRDFSTARHQEFQ